MISALGQCPIHHIDKMSVGSNDFDGQAVCIKCQADARPKEGRTQLVDDPGEEYFQGKGSKAKITIIDSQFVPATSQTPVKHAVKVSGATLEEIVASAVASLGALPMPKDIKEFKKVQKVIKTLQSLVENQNG